MQTHIDANIKIYYTDMWANRCESTITSKKIKFIKLFLKKYTRWLGLRLEFIGCLVILFASLFVVIQKDSVSPGTAGLSISYAFTISMALMW